MNQKKMSKKATCCAVFLFGLLLLTAFGKVSVQAEAPENVPVLTGKTLLEAEEVLRKEGYGYTSSFEVVR